jgi:hypothetical protein
MKEEACAARLTSRRSQMKKSPQPKSKRERGARVTAALAQMQRWFSEAERTSCPVCHDKQAIAEGSLLVCLACAALSLTERGCAGGPRENV